MGGGRAGESSDTVTSPLSLTSDLGPVPAADVRGRRHLRSAQVPAAAESGVRGAAAVGGGAGRAGEVPAQHLLRAQMGAGHRGV